MEQKTERTDTIREAHRARLKGYRLTFNKRGSDGTGKANIEEDPQGEVWGVVYRMSEEALKKMDRCEGAGSGHYRRQLVAVELDMWQRRHGKPRD